MTYANPYMVYRKQSVETVSQKQLIIMLYQGMIRFMTRASKAIDTKNYEDVHVNLTKANNIIIELLSGINEKDGGEIAGNLKRLYVFAYERLSIANINKDKSKINEIIGIMNTLLEGWQEQTAGKKPPGIPSVQDTLSQTGISFNKQA